MVIGVVVVHNPTPLTPLRKGWNLWCLPLCPNRPVRGQWEYLRKMERHFPIKPGQPIEMALVILNSFTELLPKNYLIRAKNPFVNNGTVNFGRNIPTEICGPPPEVRRNRNGPFHLNSNRNLRNLWHNGKHPISITPTVSTIKIIRIFETVALRPGYLDPVFSLAMQAKLAKFFKL